MLVGTKYNLNSKVLVKVGESFVECKVVGINIRHLKRGRLPEVWYYLMETDGIHHYCEEGELYSI